MILFDRRCAVTVGEEGGTGTRIDERFRVVFRVVKTLTTETNVSDVQIYGLGDSLRQQFLASGQVMQIEAGYAAGSEILSIADITNASIQRQPPEIITKLECQDGAQALKERKVALSFAPETPVQRVLDKLAQELALGQRATGVQVQGVYRNGLTLSTTIRDALNRVTRKADVTWSIQDRQLQILDPVLSSQGQGVLLSPTSGLINSPERIDDPENEEELRRGVGYRVRSLLNPKIRPGEQLILESVEVQGQFRIDTVEHTCDTRGNEWYTEAEVYAD
jgi:hypothetical protein